MPVDCFSQPVGEHGLEQYAEMPGLGFRNRFGRRAAGYQDRRNLRIELAPGGPPLRPMANAEIRGDTAVSRWPVEVWFSGARGFVASLDFGPRRIARIVLDPEARFPDSNWKDNVWPR